MCVLQKVFSYLASFLWARSIASTSVYQLSSSNSLVILGQSVFRARSLWRSIWAKVRVVDIV